MANYLRLEQAQELYNKIMQVRGVLEDITEYFDDNYEELKDMGLYKLLDTWNKCDKLDERMFDFQIRVEALCPDVK